MCHRESQSLAFALAPLRWRTTTTLTTSSASAILGKTVTLTAAVSPSTATGKVTFYDGASVLGIAALSEGSATWKTALLNAGSHSLTARYDGDANDAQSLSAKVLMLVQTVPASAVQANPPFDSVSYSSALYADFNDDGKVDVVALDIDSQLHVLLGNGAGAFTTSAIFPNVTTYLLGDFDGDGNTDIVIAGNFSPSFTVLLGSGDGTFRSGPVTQIPGVNPAVSLGTAADFNADGTLDLLAADTINNVVYVLTGNGDGTFRAPAVIASLFQLPAVAGDFNGDGKLDLFNLAGYFFAGNGDGTFADGVSILPGQSLTSLTAVDINNDGKLDIVALDYGTVETLLGNGNGTFQSISGPTNVNDPLILTDFNGDGKLDAVNYTSVAFGNGDGTFQSFTPIPGMQNALDALLAADLNGSGQADLIANSATSPPAVYLATYYGTVGISASPNPATYGQPLTLTASVTPATATGSVSFYSGAALLGAAPVVSGVASLALTPDASGRQVITAAYSGDSANQPAVSAPLTLPVNGASSTVSLAANNVNPTYGQTLTLSATLSPGAATGLVTFYDQALAIGVGPVTSGKAVFSTATLNTGVHSFSAQYDAGAGYSISVSNVVAVTVTPAAAGAFTAGTTVIPDLRYSVTTVDLNHDGLTDLIGLDGNGNVAVLLGTGNVAFAAPVLYPAGPSPWTLVVADVDGDGNMDVIVGNGFTVAVLFGNGDGTLRTGPTTTFQSGPFPVSIGELLPGDLNGDGKIDLLVLGYNGPAAVLLGNGDGTFDFSIPANFPTPGQGAVLGDFNGDGKLDCVLVAGDETLLFVVGNGDGTFQNPVTIESTSITGPVAAADFNGDGKLDLVVGTFVEDRGYGFGVLLGNGNGTFGPMTVYSDPGFGFIIADFNGDGKPDILVESYTVSGLFLGNGDGTFTPSSSQIDFNASAVGDFGSYAAVDVVAQVNGIYQIEFGVRPSTLTLSASPNPGTLGQPVTVTATITPSNATGTVTFYDNYTVLGATPVIGGTAVLTTSSLAANRQFLSATYSGDFQTASALYNNEVVEFVTGSASTVALAAPVGPVTYGQAVNLSASILPASATGEITFLEGTKILGSSLLNNGSAALSTALLDSGLDSIRAVYAGNSVFADGSASAVASLQVNATPGGAFVANALPPVPATDLTSNIASAVGDLNRDGIPDLVVVTSIQACAYLGNGDGTFRQSWCGSGGYNYPYLLAIVVIADFNGDGIPDLAVTDPGTGNFNPMLFNGNGDGTFTASANYPPEIYFPVALAAADMNLDGTPDLVSYGDSIEVSLGNADGTFWLTYGASAAFPAGAASLVVADFNADGKPDIAIAGNDPANVTIFLGNGDGSLQSPTNFPAGANPTLMVTADFNHDGKPDLAVITGAPTSGLSILLGNGNGSLQAPLTYSVPSGVTSIATGDFNGDGNLDVVVNNNSIVSVYYGNGDGTFQSPVDTTYPLPYLAVGDFNSDGRTDLVGLLGVVPATNCTYTSSVFPTAVDGDGGTVTLTVTTSLPGCAWSVTELTPYSVDSPEGAFGIGSGSAQLTIPANPTGVDAIATIEIGNQQLPVTVETTVTQFQDVPPGAFAFDAINLLRGKGITDGCTTTDFCPTENVTRAQMAIFIIRSIFLGDNFPYPTTQIFNDVPPSSFGYQWIQELSALGITSGCGGGSFCPDDPITREQMAVFIIKARYGATTNFPYSPTPHFTDVPVGAFAFSYIQRMDQDGITSGCTTTTYCPDDDVSRAEMAVFIMRGMFNEQMPPGDPVLTAQPLGCEISSGESTSCQLSVANATFDNTTQLSASGGLTFSSVQVSNPTTLQFTVTAPAGVTQLTPESLLVTTGTQLLVSPNLIGIYPAQ